MVLCPIAMVSHCRDCKLVRICPLKRMIGDYGREHESRFSPFDDDDDPLDDTENLELWPGREVDEDDPLD